MGNTLNITDSIFLKTVSCPLKLYHLLQGKSLRKPYLPFKQRNKLQLRDAVAFQFPNRKFTSDAVREAETETLKWMSEESVTICGAVVRQGDFLTRIPILIKSGDNLTIVQIHGKLRKRSSPPVITPPVHSRTTAGYLLKAAYRLEILRDLYPGFNFHVELYFPDKRFRSGLDNLLKYISSTDIYSVSLPLYEDINRLFTKLEATEATENIRTCIPEIIAHTSAAGKSVSEVMKKINSTDWSKGNQFGVEVHRECRNCDFRRPVSEDLSGCWNQFFVNSGINYPDKHIFELIGHGNQDDLEDGNYFQEQVPVASHASSFERLRQQDLDVITIQQRRDLQILKAHGEKVPQAWLKPAKFGFDHLEFPLHFIDFEAATYALPMQRGGKAYSPVYFQFSCHTLYENGEIVHSEWLDEQKDRGYPHREFVRRLGRVESIFNGNLIQYSPFESQALRYLLQEMNRNSMLFKDEIRVLQNLLYKGGDTQNHRFFDLSKSVREGYYNEYMEGSIGLKQVLQSIFQLKKCRGDQFNDKIQIFDMDLDLQKFSDPKTGFDPYTELQHPVYEIDDGAAAMNAYISLKSDLLSSEESQIIPTLLRRYCAMDSYALLIIYKHLNEMVEQSLSADDLFVD